MIIYYDKEGNPIDREEWVQLLENIEYRRIAETKLSDGRQISTVHIGLDHSFGDGPPLIFETMVFPSKDESADERCERYSTEEEARAGHDRIVTEEQE